MLKSFINLPATAKNPCFLHSSENGESILAYNPIAKYSGSNLNEFQKFTKKHKNCKFIGYFSYDLCYKLKQIKKTAKDDLNLPQIYFLAFKNWTKFKNHKKEQIKLKTTEHKSENFKPTLSKIAYQKAYQKIRKYLKKGEIYQINLTHRLEAKTTIPPRELFLKIIKSNPVNFLAYIEGDGFEVLSASPERFIKIQGDNIETCPIKGTRPRGKTPKEDQKLKNELLKSAKEKAELNMITDLLRNDLGEVCKAGTIKVQKQRLIQKLPNVWHTYSKITGKLAKRPLEALISMLPGGSITGCPKKRAIEIIDELEPTTRGIYTGVIGYIDNKNLDFSITIRTIIKKKEKLYLQVGGGIVYDSKSRDEYQETLDKAKSFMNILKS